MNTVTSDFLLEIYSAATSTWVDYSTYTLVGSLQIDHEINTMSVMTFTLFDHDEAMVMPYVGQQVRVSDVKSGSRRYYFGGMIDTFSYASLANGQPYRVDVKCQDWSCLLDRYYATAAYEGKGAGYIVKDLIATMDTDDILGVTNVKDDDQVPVLSVVNVPTITLKEALDELARETGYKYWVTYDKQLYWQPKSSSAASWVLSDANAPTHVYGMPSVTRDRSQYRNVQEVRGGTKADDAFQFYPPVGEDGLLAFWVYEGGTWIPPEVDLGKPISEVQFVYIGKTPRALTPDDKTDAGYAFTCGPRGANTIFVYDVGGTKLYANETYLKSGESTTYNAFEYLPIQGFSYVWCDVKFQSSGGSVSIKNYAGCDRMGLAYIDTVEQMAAIEGGSGVVYKLEINERLTTMKACQERADALIKEYGTIPTIVNYESDEWEDLTVGQLQTVTIYGLNKECLVRSIRITDVSGRWLRAEIELVGSEKQGFAQFWRAMSGGATAKMQSTYAMRPSDRPMQYTFPDDHAVYMDDTDLTYTEVTAFSAWGSGAIGEGAEWA